MHRPILIRSLTLLLVAGLLVFAAPLAAESADNDESARKAIIEVIEASYIQGAFNEQNTKAMKQGFHPIFKIHGARDGKLSTYPIADWVAGIEEGKAKEGYQQQTWEHRFPMIDITGGAAVVKVELFKVEGGKKTHVYTDYLSLLELEGGWKITDKVYHRH